MLRNKASWLSPKIALLTLLLHSTAYGQISAEHWSVFKNSVNIESQSGEQTLSILFLCDESSDYAYLIERHQLAEAYDDPDPAVASVPQTLINAYTDSRINRTFIFDDTEILDQGKRSGTYDPDRRALTLTSLVLVNSQLIGMLRVGQSVKTRYFLVTGHLVFQGEYTLNNSDAAILEASSCNY